MTTPILLHLHIPKTGGSSLTTLLEQEYGDGYCRVPNWRQSTPSVWQAEWGEAETLRRMACISGHYYFGFWRALNAELSDEMCIERPVFLTFVREPVDRLLSLYHYWRENENRYQAQLLAMSFEEFALSDGSPSGEAWEFLDNDMVRRIAGVEGVGHTVVEADYRRALEHLRCFPGVGVTERFDETVARWAERFSWSSTAYEHRLTQPERLRREELPAALIAEIESRQRYDSALYEYVLARDWGTT